MKYFHFKSNEMFLVESRSWQDQNLKFGPNCDLEVDDLEKNQKFGEAINFQCKMMQDDAR